HVVDPKFGTLLFLMRYRQVISFQLRDQNCCFRAECSWNVAYLLVMVRVALLKDINKLTSGHIYALVTRLIDHVVRQRGPRGTGNDLTCFRIHYKQFARVTCSYKEAVVSFIQCNCGWLLALLGSGPSGEQVAAVAVINLHFILAAYIYEDAWP